MHPLLVQYRAVVVKEVRQTVRDKRVIALLTIAPLVQLFVLGFAVNFDVRHVPTAVVDRDRTQESRAHARSLLASDTLKLKAELPDELAAEHLLERGDAAVALVFPPDFERELLRGQGAQVQALVDGSDPVRSSTAVDAVARHAATRAVNACEIRPRLAERRPRGSRWSWCRESSSIRRWPRPCTWCRASWPCCCSS